MSFLKYFDYFILLPLLAQLPVQMAYRLCRFRGWVQAHMRVDSRKHAERNMHRAFPSLPREKVKKLVLEHFQVKARDELEAFWYSRPLSFLSKFVRIDGMEELRRALASGKGVLFFSGHLGSLGLCGVVVSKHGIPVNIVARSIDPEENPLHPAAREYNRKKVAWIEEATSRKFLLTRRGNYPRIRELLRAGEVVMIAIDVLPQAVNPRRSVLIEFMGQKAIFADGIASLYKETEASLIQWTIHRNPETGIQELELRDVTSRVGRQWEKWEIMQTLAGLIEEKIRKYPDHWHVWDSLHLYERDVRNGEVRELATGSDQRVGR
ncbi:MAG TPA: hypothetical protein VKZ59_08470 [Acidobacteriota bacterium]|nr:hypothetical protein [Acidobacteriota bacterium]